MTAAEGGGLVLPDPGLVDPSGARIHSEGPSVVGLDVYEALGGEDAISAMATIQDLRRRREKAATLVIALGGVTVGLLVEVALFNAEVHQGRELTERDKAAIEAAVRKRYKRAEKRRKALGRD